MSKATKDIHGTHQSIYDALKEAGCELDHHESDLYVLETDTARGILNGYGVERIDEGRFIAYDGRHWLELPFQYQPFWDKKARTVPGCCTDAERGYDGDESWG